MTEEMIFFAVFFVIPAEAGIQFFISRAKGISIINLNTGVMNEKR
ncbi:hypothetical protein [Candidatus Magnetomonas plexicatena]